jgi:hypothetical protein
MTRLHDDFLEVVVFLYPSENDAQNGTKLGGTGFLVRLESEKVIGYYVYAVTNRHVIERGSTTVRINRKDGTSLILDSNEPDWFLSTDDDLAVFRFAVQDESRFSYKYLAAIHFLDQDTVESMNIGSGDEVFVTGRLVGADGRSYNQPIYRFGRIVANGTRVVDGQESFLVEARSTGGLSGSPVFIGISDSFIRPGVTKPISSRTWLLGVQWGYVRDWAPVFLNERDHSTQKVEMNTGIMCVVPAWKLWALLNREDVVAVRKAGDELAVTQGIPRRAP